MQIFWPGHCYCEHLKQIEIGINPGECVGEFHSCCALCGKSGLYVSLAEYLNSCTGSESSEFPLLFLTSSIFRGELKFANSSSVSSSWQSSFILQYILSEKCVLLHNFTPFESFSKHRLSFWADVDSRSQHLGLIVSIDSRSDLFWSQGSRACVMLWYIYSKYLMRRRLLDLLVLTQQTVPCCLQVARIAFCAKPPTTQMVCWYNELNMCI